MAMKQTQVHESKQLASNTTATLQIPTGGKIQNLFLRFTTSGGADNTEAEIRAQVGNIRLTINGQDVVNTTAARLYDLYEMIGQANVQTNTGIAGAIELNIGRLLFTDPNVRDLFGFGTVNVQSIQIQVTAGTLTTVANVQAFSGRQPVSENMGTYCRYIDFPQTFSGTGEHSVDTLPREPDTDYLLVNATNGSGVIVTGEVRANNNTIIERCPVSVNNIFCGNDRLSQLTGNFLYHFADGSLSGRLPMNGVTDLRFITNFSSAPSSYVLSALTVKNFPVLK